MAGTSPTTRTCGFTNTAAGDKQVAGDPVLGALADNGGPGPTRLPGAASPLIDAIPVASCQADGASGITTDERGHRTPTTRWLRHRCGRGAADTAAHTGAGCRHPTQVHRVAHRFLPPPGWSSPPTTYAVDGLAPPAMVGDATILSPQYAARLPPFAIAATRDERVIGALTFAPAAPSCWSGEAPQCRAPTSSAARIRFSRPSQRGLWPRARMGPLAHRAIVKARRARWKDCSSRSQARGRRRGLPR